MSDELNKTAVVPEGINPVENQAPASQQSIHVILESGGEADGVRWFDTHNSTERCQVLIEGKVYDAVQVQGWLYKLVNL